MKLLVTLKMKELIVRQISFSLLCGIPFMNLTFSFPTVALTIYLQNHNFQKVAFLQYVRIHITYIKSKFLALCAYITIFLKYNCLPRIRLL